MTNLSGTASDYFASLIEDYDSLIRRAVPGYDAMLAIVLEYLPSEPRRGLELGCGTGNLTLALARDAPDCHWTAVDASDEMVELTRARLAAEHPEVRFDVEIAQFEAITGDHGPFDVVTSGISVHHVADKAGLFERLRPMLTSGGSLCFADQFTGATPRVADRHWQRWLAHCRSPGQCTEEEVDHLLEHSEAHDHYESLAACVGHLRRAGFIDVDCVWRNGMWAVVTAEVPDPNSGAATSE